MSFIIISNPAGGAEEALGRGDREKDPRRGQGPAHECQGTEGKHKGTYDRPSV